MQRSSRQLMLTILRELLLRTAAAFGDAMLSSTELRSSSAHAVIDACSTHDEHDEHEHDELSHQQQHHQQLTTSLC
jgi:hypothetical protein